MPKKIVLWQADDGTHHVTEEAAITHETKTKAYLDLEEYFYRDCCDTVACTLEWIEEHKDKVLKALGWTLM